jgi:hypothetical protein
MNVYFYHHNTLGALVLASIDQVPDDLIDNAIILGVLSFLVAFLFLIDMSEKMTGRGKTDATQTDTSSIDRHFGRGHNIATLNSQANLVEHDGNDRRNAQNQSMRKTSDFMTIQANPMVTSANGDHQMSDFQHQKHTASSTSDYHEDNQSSFISEDIVQAKTFPTAQVATKVKQYPTIVNHLETEPYRKILNKSQSQPQYARYQDQTQVQHENPTFYDDFTKYRQETYYQGPKVDQLGKLMVIRDYSNERHMCNCQLQHENENQDDNLTIKSGYVSQVAKLWDDRTKTSGEFSSLKISPKNTHV